MINRATKWFNSLLEDNGPNISRAINFGVAVILSVAMLKMVWKIDDIGTDVTMWFWACFTTLAVYGMGVHTFNKWLDIIKLKAGGQVDSKPDDKGSSQ